MKKRIQAFIFVAINSMGLCGVTGEDFAEVESRYIGNGTFEYTLRTFEDPRIVQLSFGSLLPYSFTNYLSNTAPPHWTNLFFQGQWAGISFDSSGIQPNVNEIRFSVTSGSTDFKLQRPGFGTTVQITLAESVGGGTRSGFMNFDCLLPCSSEDADRFTTYIVSQAELLPGLVINGLIVKFGEVHGLSFTWKEPSTVELQSSHDLIAWTNVAQIYGDPPQTAWATSKSLNPFGEFFRLQLITNSHPATSFASPMSASQPEVSARGIIVSPIQPDAKTICVSFESVSNAMYEVDFSDSVGRVIETKQVKATSAFTTAIFGITEHLSQGFFKVRPITK